MRTQTDRDWPSGNYSCMCAHCKNEFSGYKRQVCCRACATLPHTDHMQGGEATTRRMRCSLNTDKRHDRHRRMIDAAIEMSEYE